MADIIYKYAKMDWITCKGDPIHVDFHIDDKIYVWCRLLCEIEVTAVITRAGLVWHLIEIY